MRKRKVPLVEDDPLVRLALVDADLEPVQAANASEAIAILQARPDIPAVLSDVGMPGPMNGLSLAWETKTRWPATPVALISGRLTPSPAMMPHDVVFLAKPLPVEVVTSPHLVIRAEC